MALGCVALLVLTVGGGVTYLVLRGMGGEDPTAAPTTTTEEEPTAELETGLSTDPAESDFEVVSPIDTPPGDADHLRGILANNPLTTGSLPDITSCELPETPVDPSDEELQAVLDASGQCLSRVWAAASSDRGLTWDAPAVQVYTYPDVPSSSCEADSFQEDYPRVCNLDPAIYWPTGFGIGAEVTDAELVPGAYLWDLSYVYMNPVMWNSSVGVYYVTLMDQVEDDPELADETWRRYILQSLCLSSAATMQLPTAVQPQPELREQLTDASNWTVDESSGPIEPSSRAHWIEAGFESGGDLGACNTWIAPAEQVA
ncbi:hypothetical protein [Brachybacterium sp. YJGR34]|uniref:hypothetical protein n=1 Tax=Brachybacterium sp. YJGR34 TaxID=2059911 RepID=UPI001E526DBF|nr:hypothetical protein [Brachybacterium sp. YJGR34]